MLTNEKLYLIEINTVPGMSKNSIIPQQAKEMGISLPRLLSAVVEGMFLGSLF
jgi:D-alanine-D-alanine ligase